MSSQRGALPMGYNLPKDGPWKAVPKVVAEVKRSPLNTFNTRRSHVLRMRESMNSRGIMDFPQGYIGQPFWFSNIGGNHFPREGFTYTPYDRPIVSFDQQMQGYVDDEDAQMGVNFLAAKATGAKHYWKGKTENLIGYIADFTKKIDLDYIAWQTAKELLAFGNSFWKLRCPVYAIKSLDDFQQLPIESLVRVWWTPDRIPQWYEFRGAKYNGYFKPDEIMHFKWNPLNGSVLGFGVMAQLTNRVTYFEDTADGPVLKERESYLDIKHGMQNVAYKSMKRYLPRNVYPAVNADEDERQQMREELKTLHDSEDIIHGIKGMEVQELGNATRAYDPNAFMDLFQGAVFKALGTSKGRIAGQSQGPTYANGEESAILDEIGLSQFPIQLKIALTNAIIKPWYQWHPAYDLEMTGGAEIFIPWDMGEFELMFGKAEKKDLTPEQMVAWANLLAMQHATTPLELRRMAEQAGVSGLLADEESRIALGTGEVTVGADDEEDSKFTDKNGKEEEQKQEFKGMKETLRRLEQKELNTKLIIAKIKALETLSK